MDWEPDPDWGEPTRIPPGFPWPVELFVSAVGVLVLLLVILTLPIWLPLRIAAAPLIGKLQEAGERRFRQRMKARGRYKEWEDLRPTLEAGGGTLIVEQALKAPVRVWWTPDDVNSLAPCPPPSTDEYRLLFHMPWPHEFVAWLHGRYTDEDVGSALLTVPADLPLGYPLAPRFHERFPDLATIDTVYT